MELRQLIVDGVDATAVVSYDYVSPAGARLHQDDAAVWKIAALTIYIDVTEFRAFMGR